MKLLYKIIMVGLLFVLCFTTTVTANDQIDNNLNTTQEYGIEDVNPIANTKTFNDIANLIAGASAGSTIYLNGDTYIGSGSQINIGKSLTIDGQGATLDAQQKSRIFNVPNGVTVILKNINFINGKVTGTGVCGGAIYVNNAKLTVNNSTFNNNKATESGGAIFVYDYGTLQVTNSNFTSNSVDNNGGGAILISRSSDNNIVDCNFITNSATWGGAVYTGYSTDGSASITGCTFTSNTAKNAGGGVLSRFALAVNNSTFIGNRALNSDGGGAIIEWEGSNSIKISNSTFKSNTATSGKGGAVHGKGTGNMEITNSTFTGNAANTYGGAVCSGGAVTVIDSEFKQCTANSGGKDVYANGQTVNLICNDYDGKARYTGAEVVGNLGTYIVSGTFAEVQYRIDNTPINGVLNLKNKKYTAEAGESQITISRNIVINGNGATLDADNKIRIMAINTGVSVNLNNLTFINGKVNGRGGAIYVSNNANYNFSLSNSNFTNNSASIDGGAIFLDSNYDSNTIVNCNFNSNNAGVNGGGGAIYIGKYYSGGFLNITNSNFTNNQAGWGGAFCSYMRAIVINSTFTRNQAVSSEGGAIGEFGGAYLKVIDSTFDSNAGRDGGAVYSNAEFIGSCLTFTNNTATIFNNNYGRGGAISSGSSNIAVSNSTFIDNSANNMGGSIYAPGVLNVKDSTFNSTNITGKAVIYINNNNKNVNLTNNTIQSILLPIYNNNGNIISPTTLTFNNVTADVGKNAKLTATLKDDNGNLIGSNINVAGKVNGTASNFVFDETTQNFTSIYTPQNIGKYSITGTYSKASSCNVTNGTLKVMDYVDINVNFNSKVYCNFSGNITVLPSNVAGNVAGNITIKVNGTKYYQVTLSDGKADWSFTNVTPGNYNVTFEYSGDEYYYPAFNSTLVDIGKATADIGVNVTNTTYGENTTVKVNVTGINGTDLSGNVTVTIQGISGNWNGTVNHEGIGEIIISGLPAGNHTAFIEYSGNNNYTQLMQQLNSILTRLMPQ